MTPTMTLDQENEALGRPNWPSMVDVVGQFCGLPAGKKRLFENCNEHYRVERAESAMVADWLCHDVLSLWLAAAGLSPAIIDAVPPLSAATANPTGALRAATETVFAVYQAAYAAAWDAAEAAGQGQANTHHASVAAFRARQNEADEILKRYEPLWGVVLRQSSNLAGIRNEIQGLLWQAAVLCSAAAEVETEVKALGPALVVHLEAIRE